MYAMYSSIHERPSHLRSTLAEGVSDCRCVACPGHLDVTTVVLAGAVGLWLGLENAPGPSTRWAA
jgi:hypothetical protein